MNPIINKLNQRVTTINSLLCVGLDTDVPRIPPSFQTASAPQWRFNQHIIKQTHPFTAAYKPNMAFYEAAGTAGFEDLAATMDDLRRQHPSIVTICDAKRADIGSTSEAYARAIFDQLGFDAVTLNPYLGRDALAPFLERTDKLSIILCRTSNPDAREFQDLQVEGRPLWEIVADTVASKWNQHGNCALVVGATVPDQLRRVRARIGEMWVLVPGVGAQGGSVDETLSAGLDVHGRGLLINASRSIIFAEHPDVEAQTLRDQINRYRP